MEQRMGLFHGMEDGIEDGKTPNSTVGCRGK